MPRTRRESKVFPINIRELTVLRIADLSPGMRRVTLGGPQLQAFVTEDGIDVPQLRNEGFDDHVKVIVPGADQEAAVPPRQVEGHLDWSLSSPGKDYTPRRWDPERGELDLDFVRHSTGLASTWVEHLAVGDPAYIAGPKTSALMPDGFDWMLVGGDETALPAIGRMLEEWPAGVRGQVFIEVAERSHELEVARPDGVEVTYLHRDGIAAGHSTLLSDAVCAAPWWDGEVFCWFSGEAMSLKPIRSYLKVDREVPRECIDITGYWRRTEAVVNEQGRTVQEHDPNAPLIARLQQLLDLNGPVAIRAAGAIGLLPRLERSAASAVELARDLDVSEPVLRALVRYLATFELVTLAADDPTCVGDAPVELGPLGSFLLAEADDFDDPGARFFDFSTDQLVHTLRTGQVARRYDGSTAAQALAQPGKIADAVAEETRFGASWVMPSVVQHHTWGDYTSVIAIGPGADALAAQLHSDLPELSVARAGAPGDGAAVAAASLLERLDDEAAVSALRELAAQIEGTSAELVLAERTRDTDEAVHDHDAELDLALHVWFGSGLRTPAETEALLEQAGLVSSTPDGIDVGWDTRLWVLAAAGDRRPAADADPANANSLAGILDG